MKFRARWTWPWGPPFVVRINLFSPFPTPPFLSTTLFADRVVDGVPCQIAAMVAIIASAYLHVNRVSPSLPFPSLFSIPPSPLFYSFRSPCFFFYPGS